MTALNLDMQLVTDPVSAQLSSASFSAAPLARPRSPGSADALAQQECLHLSQMQFKRALWLPSGKSHWEAAEKNLSAVPSRSHGAALFAQGAAGLWFWGENLARDSRNSGQIVEISTKILEIVVHRAK